MLSPYFLCLAPWCRKHAALPAATALFSLQPWVSVCEALLPRRRKRGIFVTCSPRQRLGGRGLWEMWNPGGKPWDSERGWKRKEQPPGGGSSVLHGPPSLLLCLGEGPSCLHSCPSECHCHMSMSCLCLGGGGPGVLERCSVFMTSRVSP